MIAMFVFLVYGAHNRDVLLSVLDRPREGSRPFWKTARRVLDRPADILDRPGDILDRPRTHVSGRPAML